jgi:uncharacterized Zn finger protein
VLYGIGARLDEQPELLFRLRAVDEQDLLARIDTTLPLTKQGQTAGKVLDTDDLSALFGLDMEKGEEDGVPPIQRKPIRAKKPAQSEPSGGRLKTAVQKSVRSQPEGRNETVIKPTPIGEASFGKQVRPKAIAKAKAAAKAARKARATVA